MLTLCILGIVLRFAGLSWGLPYNLHADEPVVLEHVEQLSWGDLDPHFFIYPGFFLYQLFLVGRLVALAGGGYPELLYVARALTAGYSVATVAFVYLLGARLGGRRLGIIAAALVAMTGALVLHAHYAVTDTPATALATAVLWLAVRARQRASTAGLIAAAAVAGLAVSTKYSMAPVCLAPWLGAMALAAADGAPAARRARLSVTLAGAALAAFLVTSPYTLLDYRGFVRDIGVEGLRQSEGRAGEHDAPLTDLGLGDRGLVGNAVATAGDLGPAALALALVTTIGTLAGRGVARSPTGAGRVDAGQIEADRVDVGPENRRRAAAAAVDNGADAAPLRGGDADRPGPTDDRVGRLLVIVWVLAYFALMAPSGKFGQRYALPLYPALMVLAAVPVAALSQGGSRLGTGRGARRAGLAAVVLLLLAMAPPAAAALDAANLLRQRDTRLVARDWIVANLPPGSRLAREFYAPPIHGSDGFAVMQPFALSDNSLAAYCRAGVDYLLLSSLNERRYFDGNEARFANQRAWYDRLEHDTRLVHRVAGRGNLAGHQPTIEVRRLYCGSNR